ncbi:biotin attachment protein [Glaciecola punicea]|uniref:efflux RND transporter periplasmic adaptor subunit n=1 Tax=Glaciecola punicea TaxID=56804 RepID=UPI0008720F9E|nr:efflux RND transporter periplasmic adaptor subunit [Glaciecola punicea]OFA29951.1 biotin attachment protein [Glaciecola punicea]
MNYTVKLSQTLSHDVAMPLRLFVLVCLAMLCFATLAGESAQSNEYAHADEFVTLSAEMANANGLQTMAVTSGQLQILATAYGDVITDPASLSHIRARFDGVISAVTVNLGDSVKLGDTLATVESNESLKQYKITSPFSGNVIARHANAGELSNGQILFSIANYDDVWARLKVFPKQLSSVKAGQQVMLTHTGVKQSSTISHIAPSPDGKPYTLAYIRVNNKDGQWPVGALVSGQITVATSDVALLIPKTAIQTFEEKSVVFVLKSSVREGHNEYHPRPVLLGTTDNMNIEIVNGLQNGERIVSLNSYLLKADLEKSEAGHDH